ncbi:MFS transporter [Parenemella sanctibonifatiensis]|uniref:MFS transporter n=1 Tax=Parenemella sanctibonifatiensis TaxID=2016505 RepID=UPI0015C5E987|nr:MFS transporter [Parenemella sanctibonifatiensis]
MRAWLGVVTLAVGIFTMVTIEELPIGVLTLIAEELNTSEGIVGLGVTLPGLLAGVISVLTPLAIGRLDRRLAMAAALVVVTLACVVTMLSDSVGLYLVSRMLVGFSIGVFWAVVAVTAVRIVPAHRAALATTVVFSGASAAVVMGVPFATFLGTWLGWRMAFVVVGGFALLVAAALLLLVPSVPVRQALQLADLAATFRQRGVQIGVVLTGLLVTGHFVAYTYASPMLQELTGVGPEAMPTLLLSFGVAGLIGNFAVAPLLQRNVPLAVALIGGGIAVALTVIWLFVSSPAAALAAMAGWGIFGGAVSVSVQNWVLRAAKPGTTEPATALNSAMYNVSIALGALLGGQLIDSSGIPALVGTAVVMVVLAATVATVGRRYARAR